jgi:hypothetical protein
VCLCAASLPAPPLERSGLFVAISFLYILFAAAVVVDDFDACTISFIDMAKPPQSRECKNAKTIQDSCLLSQLLKVVTDVITGSPKVVKHYW